MCKCRSAQCRCSSLQPGRRCCCSSRSSAYLPHQGRVEVAKKQQQQGLCCRGRQGPPPGFPSPRPHWSRPVLPGWVAADTAGGGTSAILRSAKSPLSRSAGPNRGEFKLQLMRAKRHGPAWDTLLYQIKTQFIFQSNRRRLSKQACRAGASSAKTKRVWWDGLQRNGGSTLRNSTKHQECEVQYSIVQNSAQLYTPVYFCTVSEEPAL